jgi:hypothetical protein
VIEPDSRDTSRVRPAASARRMACPPIAVCGFHACCEPAERLADFGQPRCQQGEGQILVFRRPAVCMAVIAHHCLERPEANGVTHASDEVPLGGGLCRRRIVDWRKPRLCLMWPCVASAT